MVNIIVPLYIYPTSQAVWDPLVNAAQAFPSVTFQTIVNLDSGPGGSQCPDSSYAPAIGRINELPNIQTIGYVHTSFESNCGPNGNWICTCSAPLDQLEANITKYANFRSCSTTQDLGIDGIFFDESPGQDGGECLEYLTAATNFAEQAIPDGVFVYNAGTQPDERYWTISDADIVVAENNGADFARIGNISDRTVQGRYNSRADVIVYDFNGDLVEAVSRLQEAGLSSIYFTDRNGYTAFPSNLTRLAEAVQRAS